MDIWIILVSIGIILNLSITLIYIFSKNILKSARFHLSISFLSLTIWGTTQLVNYLFFSEYISLFIVRIAYGLVAVLIIHIFYFIKGYSSALNKGVNYFKTLSIDLIVIIISLFPIFVHSVYWENNTIIARNNNIPLFIFIIAILILVGLILTNLISILRHKGNEIIRFSFLLFSFAILITVVIGVSFSYILPNFTPIQEKVSPMIGYSATIIFSLVTAYVFSRTQYFSLEIYIRILLSASLKIIFFLISFLSISQLQILMWGSVFNTNAIILGIIISIIFTLFTDQLYSILRKYTKTNSLDLSQNWIIFKSILESKTYEDLFIKIGTLVENEGIPTHLSLLIMPDNIIYGEPYSNTIRNQIKTFLSNNNVLILSEYKLQHPKLQIAFKLLENSNIEIVKSIKSDDTIEAILIFSKKINNQIFTIDELKFIDNLDLIVNQALENIKMIETKENFNLILQQKVDSQTKALQEAYDRLKREDEGKNDILNIVSHQLLTPISIIRGEIEELKDVINDEHKERPIIDTLAFQSKRSYEIVDEILRVSRVIQSGGAMTINRVSINIIEMLENIVKTFDAKAKAKGIKLNFILPTKAKEILLDIDKEKITEAVSNLIDNAINYTQKGKVSVEIIDYHKSVDILIKDTGIGIKKENLNELFNKFIRLDNAKQVRPDGTGIGLYFVKLVIDAHKGKVSVDSEGEGKGSVFTIKLLK